MRILFDSHALVWFLAGERRFSPRARAVIEADDTIACVSAVTVWEIANKVRLAKWPEAVTLAANFSAVLSEHGFEPVPVTVEHARLAGSLPARHRDPFDRMLAAQSEIERMRLVTADPIFSTFGTQVVW